ncbi:MAG TPA: hypothetical protein PK306_03955 [Aquabacterium sp.]|nr:hypothetical protein [Aquabacterium sp.]HQC94841.1 hypothetical protein [Aquabacterium sp.]
MNHSEWMKDSGRGILTPRSGLLKKVDKALEKYDKSPGKTQLDALSQAIDDWTASKDDWKTSVRADSMAKLMMFVRRAQGVAVGRAVADFAVRRMHERGSGEWLVSIQGQQTLHYPSPGYDSYCNQWFGGNHDVDFPMTVNFGIVRHGTAFVVNVRALASFKVGASTHVPLDEVLSHWKTHCESTWNCAVIYVGQRKYDLLFNLIWVKPGTPGPYYEVKVHQPPATAAPTAPVSEAQRKANAQTKRSGTPHLGEWGAEDRQAIAHEFGHMIGNPDEYLCVGFSGLAASYEASMYDRTPFTVPSIMNNTAENGCRVYERHFGMVVQEIRRFLESTDPRPIPNVRVAIEKPANGPSAVEFTLSQAMHKRRAAMGYDDD